MNKSSDLAALQARCEALQREQAELARFALIGQAFIGLTHELNNALNSMMLQTSVVQMRVDEQGRQELAAIRQHGAEAAGLVRKLQGAVQERREKPYSVDLNTVLSEILEEEAELRPRIEPSMSQKAPIIQSTHSAVKQLVRLVLEGICKRNQAAVKAATAEQESGAVLSLTISGAGEDSSSVETALWNNLDEVGRLAGQSLLRQLGGTVTAERADNEWILRLTWRQAG